MTTAEAPERTAFEEQTLEVTKRTMQCVPLPADRSNGSTNGYGYGTEVFRKAHAQVTLGMTVARQSVIDIYGSRTRSMRKLGAAIFFVGLCVGYFIRVLTS